MSKVLVENGDKLVIRAIKKSWFFCIILFSLFSADVACSLNQIDSLQLVQHSHFWRLEICTRETPVYHSFGLTNPNRLVMDFNNTQLNSRLARQFQAQGPLSRLRFSQREQTLRLVFDLTNRWPVTHHIVQHCAQADIRMPAQPAKKIIEKAQADIQRPAQSAKKNIEKIQATKKPKQMLLLKPVVSLPQLSIGQQARPIIVMIDPGHGGKDPGATSADGQHEKDIVFSIAQKVQKDLNQQKGFHAKLTRHGDYYLTLRERLNIAREQKGDVFISIHADAYDNTTAHGVSVFALSQRGATSEAARWLAVRENRSELMGGVSLADKGNILRSVLIDLSQTATIGASLQMGQQVLWNLSSVAFLHHHFVEQAAFVVLKSPDIPSLLVETGFLSSRKESSLLTTSSYQTRVAFAIMQGVKQYFVQHPPPNTLIAAMEKNDRHYYVRPGDTVAKIANQFQISARQLINTNALSLQSRLPVGQLLLVPMSNADREMNAPFNR